MENMMEHNGYWGSVLFSEEDNLLYGKVEFIRSLISYEAATAKGLKKAFREAVDDYLAMCRKQGKEPEKPFKGSFNIRVSPALHRKLAMKAHREKTSLNKLIATALEKAMERI
ncbi:MAG: type II toxin-antitoxin system HicB family antitoxin [Nitrospinae bacterium]|nr:type II toxin-antitoxin system HicB family antitoxin [Nitrospinota bacterium]